MALKAILRQNWFDVTIEIDVVAKCRRSYCEQTDEAGKSHDGDLLCGGRRGGFRRV